MGDLSVRSRDTYDLIRARIELEQPGAALDLVHAALYDLDQAEARATTLQNANREHIDKIDEMQVEIDRLRAALDNGNSENEMLAAMVNLEMELEAMRVVVTTKLQWDWATRSLDGATVYEHDDEQTARYYERKKGSALLRRVVTEWQEVHGA